MTSLARRVVSFGSCLVLFWLSPAAAQTEVTSCGQVVTGNAHLSADLDCTGFEGESFLPDKPAPTTVAGAAVLVSRKGTLDLQGHSIIGGQFGVYCGTSCTVRGGTITGATSTGIFAAKNLTVRNATVSGVGDTALFVQRILKVYDSTVTGNRYVTWFGNTVKLVRSTVTGNTEHAITGNKIELIDSTVTGNGLDIGSSRIPRLKNSTCETSSCGPDHVNVCGG
jgi:hypothetical protein